MIRKIVFYVCLLLVFASCKKEKYVATFFYTVNGETFTVKGGGVGYDETFYADTLKWVVYRTMLHGGIHGKKPIERERTQSYGFVIHDDRGGRKSHFDLQNADEVSLFSLTYKGDCYWAISGFVDIKKENTKDVENMGIRGTFEAVMGYPRYSLTDTIVVKGSFYFSHMTYSYGHYD